MLDIIDVLHLKSNVLTWNSHSKDYVSSKDNMLNFQGSLTENAEKVRIFIQYLEEDDDMMTSSHISSI